MFLICNFSLQVEVFDVNKNLKLTLKQKLNLSFGVIFKIHGGWCLNKFVLFIIWNLLGILIVRFDLFEKEPYACLRSLIDSNSFNYIRIFMRLKN